MKKIFVLAIGLFFIPIATSGMQPMTETEMDTIIASAGISAEIGEENNFSLIEADNSVRQERNLSLNESEAKSDVRRMGSGVAIFINDVVIYNSGSTEIWYQAPGANIGMHN